MLSIGVDIGGTKVAAGVVAPDGTVVEKVVRPTPASTPAAVEDAIVETVDQLRAQHTAAAVGIGAVLPPPGRAQRTATGTPAGTD